MCHRETLQCGIWASNDRGGADILVTSATAFPVPGIYGRPVDGIAVGAPPDAAQDQYGSKMGDPPLPSIVTPKLSCIIPVVNGTSGMSGGGLPGMGSDPDEA